MRVLVCGGRDFLDYQLLRKTLYETHYLYSKEEYVAEEITIIQGGAKGADFLAKVYAYEMGHKCEEFPADWKKYGLSAGMIRNKQMLVEGKPDVVVAFPGGRGTDNMIRQAEKAGVRVHKVD